MLQKTVAAESILQVGIDLHLLGKLQGLDLNESGANSLHVALCVAEGDPARSDGVLVSVGVNASVDNSTKKVVEDVCKSLR